MKRVVFYVFVILTLVLSLTSCDASAKPAVAVPPLSAVTVTPSETAAKMYPDKPLVYDQYAKEGEYAESKSSSPYTYAYHVPSINLKSDDAAKINAEINALCMPYINDALDCIKSGVSISTFNIDYHYYENYGTLSLLVRINRYGDRFKVYAIDTSSGKKLSNTELLAKRSISEEKFLSSVKEFAAAKFKQQYAGEPGAALDTERYNKTVDINNINTDMPMYFDSDGTLCVIAKIYSPAGIDVPLLCYAQKLSRSL